MASYGLDMLADYLADEVVNTKLKANPAPATRARKAETREAKTALADAEVALAKLLADPAFAAKTQDLRC